MDCTIEVTHGSIPEIDGFPEWIVTCETGKSERKENIVRLARVKHLTINGELIREHKFAARLVELLGRLQGNRAPSSACAVLELMGGRWKRCLALDLPLPQVLVTVQCP